jgi:PAS domain S-box-containing protein
MEIARMQIRMASLLISSLYETKVKQMEAEAEVKRQKELLETIINGMSDALIISDKNGKILKINNEAKRQYFQIAKTSVMGETRKTTRYMDLSRNEIQYEDMPGIRALRGEVIRNRKIIMQRPDKELVLDISCIPIFDEKENIEIIIACSRDITETFLHEQTVKIHQELLLKSEIEKRQALEDTIRLKDEFLYLITHEFKTPMAVVNSALQAISSVCRDDVTPRLDKYISIIKRNINRQLRLVNNLLDITCMNSGYMKMDKSNFDIVFVTKTIVNSVKLYSKQKEINLNFM